MFLIQIGNMMGICMNKVFLMADGIGYGFVEHSSLELPSFCTLQIGAARETGKCCSGLRLSGHLTNSKTVGR